MAEPPGRKERDVPSDQPISMKQATPLTVFEDRPLFLVTTDAYGPVQTWPVPEGPFSLLVSSHGPERPAPDSLQGFARDVLAAGAKLAVCTGPWAKDIEEAILDAQGEQEQRDAAPDWEDVLVSAAVEGPIAEATWQAWNLFATGNPPLVALFLEGDPCLERFETLARDLRSTFAEVLEADSEVS